MAPPPSTTNSDPLIADVYDVYKEIRTRIVSQLFSKLLCIGDKNLNPAIYSWD